MLLKKRLLLDKRLPLKEETAPEEKQKIPDIELPYLCQGRGRLPGLVVPRAIYGTFRRITEGTPCSRKVNVGFSALQEGFST